MIVFLSMFAVCFVLLVVCFCVWCEIRYLHDKLSTAHWRANQAVNSRDELRGKCRELECRDQDNQARIRKLEAELASLNEFRNAVVAANAALDEDEE